MDYKAGKGQNPMNFNPINLVFEKQAIIDDKEFEQVAASGAGVIYLDEQYQVVSMNREAEVLCNVDREQVLGRTAKEAFAHLNDIFTKLLDTEKENEFTSQSFKIAHSSQTFYLNFDSLRLSCNGEAFSGMIIIIHNVSALRSALKQIQTTQMLMSLGEVAAGVAHHIRTPLTTISGYLQVMLSRLQDEHCLVRQDIVEMLLDEVSHINSVVKELVLFAKPPIQKEDNVNINRLVEEALLHNFQQFDTEKIDLRKQLAPELPAITADSNLIKQAFVNIVENALEAMPTQGLLSVKSWLNVDLNMLVVAITDTGVGVSRDNLSRIFEPFYTSKLDHMGLGLSVAHRIISEHGGFIHIHEEENNGTKVHVYLPILESHHSQYLEMQQQILNLQ